METKTTFAHRTSGGAMTFVRTRPSTLLGARGVQGSPLAGIVPAPVGGASALDRAQNAAFRGDASGVDFGVARSATCRPPG